MAEMETYHSQKVEDFATITKEHLDGEIDFYEQVIKHPLSLSLGVISSMKYQVLSKLRNARRTFDPPQYDQLSHSPRQPSIYERELENPRLVTSPLPQPCPHVYDSAPMRPVSVAIQEGVGVLLGRSSLIPTGRASVFSKFW